MSVLHHQTTIDTSVFNGPIQVGFMSTGKGNDLEIQILEAWVNVENGRAVAQIDLALRSAVLERPPVIELQPGLFPLICNGCWEDLIDRAQRDREASRSDAGDVRREMEVAA